MHFFTDFIIAVSGVGLQMGAVWGRGGYCSPNKRYQDESIFSPRKVLTFM